MKIGIPKEVHTGEKRVAGTPDTLFHYLKLGFEVLVEKDAGAEANYSDAAYAENGARIVDDARTLWAESDIVIKVRAPEQHPVANVHETELLKEGGTLISVMQPALNPDLLQQLASRKATALSLDSIPRISRAQKMDVLSSMANIAGYRAVMEAANVFGRFFTGQITAAGKVPPAKVMIIGAGVAGLSAVGTSVALGAIVRAFDTRPEVKEQVESMGAEFLELDFEEAEDGTPSDGYAKVMSQAFIDAEMALFAEQAKEVDIIITTALIPGRKAPVLITPEMVQSMKPGSVIVDLAAESGGNCPLTEANKVVVKHGVTLIGYTDLPSRLATQSSQLFATNVRHLITDMCPGKDGHLVVDMEDVAVRGATVVKAGEVTWPPPKISVSAAPKAPPVAKKEPVDLVREAAEKEQKANRKSAIILGLSAILFLFLGRVAPSEFLTHFTVFVLAIFVGFQVVWNVKPALHTPLMSVTNAISGIIIIGAMLQVSAPGGGLVVVLALIAVLIATINIAGGFLVTQRMLKMFRR